MGTGEVPSALYCRQSMVEHLDADEISDITRGGFEVFEEHFGIAYPFGKYDQAFVPEYNGGAMENVGCVTLRDEYLFRSKVTAASLDYRRNTILHELSHMWFGDLVTMRWWDDLWLKESFATWSASFAVSEQADDPELSWAAFASSSKTSAYRQDQLPSTHPVAADIVDLDAVELNFDMITYAKGASLVAQLVSFVGRDAFLAGVRDYFATHAYGNTALSDLLVSLQRTSDRDLSGWSAQWLETAGVNTLRLELAADDEGVVTEAVLTQTAPERHPTLREHRVALGLYGEQDGRLVRTGRLEQDVAGPRTSVPGLVGQVRPAAVVVNDDDLTYAKIRLDPESLATVLAGLPTVTSALTRAVLWGGMWDICRDAELPAADYVDLVLRGVAAETDATAVRNLLSQAGIATYSYAPPSGRGKLAETWTQGLADRLAEAPAGSDLQLALARAFAGAANPGWSGERLHRWWSGAEVPEGLVLDADLRWLLLSNLSRLGLVGEAEIAAEQERDPSVTGSEQAAGVRAAQPDGGGQGRGVAARGRVGRDHQHRPAVDLPLVLATRSGRRAAALRRPLPRRGGGHLRPARGLGRPRRGAAQERAALAVPVAHRQAGGAGPAGPVVGAPLSDGGPPDHRRAAGRPGARAALPGRRVRPTGQSSRSRRPRRSTRPPC